MMMVAMLSVGFVSCGGDDDDGFPNWPDAPGGPPSGGGWGIQPHDFKAVNADGVTIYYKFTDNNTAVEVWRDRGLEASYRGKVVIPSSVTHNGKTYAVIAIGEGAFSCCSDLTEITIPNSVMSIGRSAFYYCRKLESVTIPNSVTKIGEVAFVECGLESVTIGNSVAEIGDYAFAECKSLYTLYSLNTTPPNVHSLAFYTANNYDGCYERIRVFVPQEALEAYRKAGVWKDFRYLRGFDPTELKLR